MKPRFIQFIPAIIWFIIIVVLLVIPSSDIPSEDFLSAIYFDKWVHAGLFGGMVFLTMMPYVLNLQFSKRRLLMIAIASALFGVIMEYVQKYTDRDFDYYDMIADAVGCVLAYFFTTFVAKKYISKKQTTVQ